MVKSSGSSRISSLKSEEHGELAFLRAERAAIREFDGGMTREQAEYFSILDVPCIPIRNTNVSDE